MERIVGALASARRSSAVRFGLAAVVTLAALGIRMALDPLLRDRATFLPFVLAIMAASYCCGRLPGLLSTAISTGSVDWFLTDPRHSLAIRDPYATASLAVFVITGALISVSLGRLRESLLDARLAQTAQRLSEERLEFAARAAGIGIWSRSSADRDLAVAGDWKRLFGLQPDVSVTVQTWRRAVHPDDRDFAVREMELAVEQHRGFEIEYRIVWPNGDLRWITDRGSASYDRNGRPIAIAGVAFDVTELKRAQDRVRQQMHEYEALAENAPEVIARFDSELRHIFINTYGAKVYGLSKADILGRTNADLGFPEEQVAFWKKNFDAVFAGGEERTVDFAFDSPNLGHQYFSSLFVPECDGGGRIVSILAITRDVTSQKRAEQVLRENEARQSFLVRLGDTLRPLADAAQIQFAATAILGEHLAAGRVGYAECLGDDTVVIGRHYTSGLGPIEGSYHLNDYGAMLLPELLAGRAIVANDIAADPRFDEAQKATYASLPVGSMANIPLVKDGRLVAILFAHFRDARTITAAELSLMEAVADRTWASVERARAEQAMRASEERFRTLANTIPQLAFMSDADGWIYWYNDRWYQYTGTTPEQMEGWGWQSVHDPAILPAVMETWKGSLESGEPFDMVFPLRGADGEFRPFLTRVVPLRDAQGNVTRWFGTNTDITGQRLAEDALRRQARLLEISFDAIIVWCLDGTVETWNAGAERLYGFSEREAHGRVSHELLSTSFPKSWPEVRAELLEKGFWEGELRHRTRDGRRLVVSTRLQLIVDQDGIRRVLEINRDITDQYRAEQALRVSEERFRKVFETCPTGIAILDFKGAFQHCNPAFCDLLGYPEEEVVGRLFPSIIPAEDLELNLEATRRLKSGEIPFFRNESRYLRKDGQFVWVDKTVSLLTDASGNPTNVVALATDITERKRAVEEIRHREEVLEAFFNASPGILSIGDEDLRFVRTDRLTPTYFGLTRESIVGRSILDLSSGLTQDVGPVMRGVLETGEPVLNREAKLPSTTVGQTHWMASYFPLPLPGGKRGIGIMGVDITELKKAQREIAELNTELETRVRQRTAQLEAANRELEAFAYSVSHDLRSPLRGIDGWSLALAEDYGAQLGQKAREYLDRVRSEAQRMGSLIDDMLQLSRITRSQMANEPVDLTAIAQTVATRLREAQPDRRIEFLIQAGLTSKGDAGLMDIALTNLLGNAVKFTGPRENARIEFGQVDRGQERFFYVRDNGVGFNMASAGKLFGAFQRLHRASEFPGSGIGLATVQRIIHRHSGRVWAESQHGEGATFYFTLDS